MENYIKRGSLNIHNALDRFLSDEVLLGLDITSDEFWKKFEDLLRKFHQRNKDLLDEKIISNSSFNTLIVIGDARNNYRPINTETIDKLSKKFYNIYWMNPERSQYWNTGDSQFHLYQSISKKYSEVSNF